MYHSHKKEDPYLRKAIYETYHRKCLYCGRLLEPRDMQIDHILAVNAVHSADSKFQDYLHELRQNGFDTDHPDYIENYALCCGPCNLEKRNRNFELSNLRYYHDVAKKKTDQILQKVEQYKKGTDVTDFIFNPDDLLHDLEPGLKAYMLEKFDAYKAENTAVQTPQLLLMLMTYSGSDLVLIFNGYEMTDGRRYGDYLVDFFRQTDEKYKCMGRSYREQNRTAFLRILEKAKEVLHEEKYEEYITANILCYTILEFSGGTTVEMMRKQLGEQRFSQLKTFVLEDRFLSIDCMQ